MKKVCLLILSFALILIYVISCTVLENKEYIEIAESYYINENIIENLELEFLRDEKEREKLLLGSKLYSSSIYTLSFNTLDFEGISNVKLVIESADNPNEIRVPIFKGFLGTETFSIETYIEENTNYSLDIPYYAVHRADNNDWNGKIKVSVLYDCDNKRVREEIDEYSFVEPCVPTEFNVFYESFAALPLRAFTKYGSDYEAGTVQKMSQVDPRYDGDSVEIQFNVTRIYYSYKSRVKDEKHNNGYVATDVEVVLIFREGEFASYMKSTTLHHFLSPNSDISKEEQSTLALKAWRAGTTIYEVRNNENSNYNLMSDLIIDNNLLSLDDYLSMTVVTAHIGIPLYVESDYDDRRRISYEKEKYDYINYLDSRGLRRGDIFFYKEILDVREDTNIKGDNDTIIDDYINNPNYFEVSPDYGEQDFIVIDMNEN